LSLITTDVAAESARDAYNKAQSKVTKMENKIRDLTEKHKKNYGDELEFATFDGQCFERKIQQYAYEMCPYKSAVQKEGSSSTSLGSWSNLEISNRTDDAGTPFTTIQFKFTGGQACWNGYVYIIHSIHVSHAVLYISSHQFMR